MRLNETQLENQRLRNAFDRLKLPLADVMDFYPEDMEIENARLERLLMFTHKYLEHRSQQVMELTGHPFPPIFPGISPDIDWLRFEKWIDGQPTRQKYKDRLPDGYELKAAADLSDHELNLEIENIKALLGKTGYGIGFVKELPNRLVYEMILEDLEEEDMMGGGWVNDGCSGYCPGCVQRPWCDTGHDLCFTEDEEAGKMALPEALNKYVSVAPGSLAFLLEAQRKNDKEMEEFRKNSNRNKDTGSDFSSN